MRISTMKWQAVSVVASSRHRLAREQAAALLATLDGITSTNRKDLEPEALKSAQARIESMAQLRDHAPKRRAAGRS
jgi:hypothetical protein